ncbi:MAG: hypothetical protein ACKVHE_27990 [Planctomycetales bacterium]
MFVVTGFKQIASAAFICSLALTLSGCGGGAASVTLIESKGKVLLDGEPLANAQVSFIPASGPSATGTTTSDGTFKLTTGGRLGAVPGECRVTVFAVAKGSTEAEGQLNTMKPEDMANMAGTPEFDNLMDESSTQAIPSRYSKPDTSKLAANVSNNPADNDFFFELTKE